MFKISIIATNLSGYSLGVLIKSSYTKSREVILGVIDQRILVDKLLIFITEKSFLPHFVFTILDKSGCGQSNASMRIS